MSAKAWRDVITAQVEEIIAGSGILGDFIYDISFSVVQVTEGGLAVQPNILLLIGEKHPTDIGAYITAVTAIPGPIPAPGHLDASVLTLMNQLAQSRQEAVDQAKSVLLS